MAGLNRRRGWGGKGEGIHCHHLHALPFTKIHHRPRRTKGNEGWGCGEEEGKGREGLGY